MSARELITEHLDLWTGAVTKKSSSGRGSKGKVDLTGIKKLRELILELAVQGKLVEQDPRDQPASELLKVVADEKAQALKDRKIPKSQLGDTNSSISQSSVPSGWAQTTLSTIGYWAIGNGFPKAHQGESGLKILFCKVSDMNISGNDREIHSTTNSVSEETALSLKLNIHRHGTVIFPKIGGAISTNKRRFIVKPTAIDNNCLGITPTCAISSDYLYLFLTSIDMTQYQVGTSVPALSQGTLGKIPIKLPPLEEQHRIVQKVDELMALCDRLEQQTSDQLEAHETLVDTLLGTLAQSKNATELADNWARLAAHFDTLFTTEQSIDKLKQTILQLAVMGRLVEQDAGEAPAQTLLKRISEEKHQLFSQGAIKKPKKQAPIDETEKLFGLPHGWAWARLEDTFINIVDCPHSTPKFIDQGKLCLDTNSFKDGKLNPVRFRYVSDDTFEKRNARLQPQPSDIVFAREGSVGESVVIPSNIECCLGQRVMLFRPSSYAEPNFLRLTLSNPLALEVLLSLHKGIGAKHVNVSDMRKYVIALPPAEEQHRIIQKVDELMALCDQLKERLTQASDTRCQLANAVVEGALN